MERSNFQERRRHRRARIHMEAVLQGETPEQDVRLTVLNFSAGGFFCEASRQIRPMTRLGITFQFPPYAEHPPRRIDGGAVVVRCERSAKGEGPYRVGACFTELNGDAREHIQGYVDWHRLIHEGEDEPGPEQAVA